MIISVILILNVVIIFIIIKFEKELLLLKKSYIWFEGIKNFKNLGQTNLLLLLSHPTLRRP